MPTEEDEILDALREARDRQRGYANFDHWPDSPIQDRGVAEDFVAALAARDGLVLPALELVPRGKDPPDLWAGDTAIELTELVDQQLVEAGARQLRQGVQPDQYRDWSADQLVAHLRRLVERKDSGKPKEDRPWQKYWLVIHTDEPGLTPELVATYLDRWEPVRCDMLTRAFLFMSYFSVNGGRPLFNLPLDGPGECGSTKTACLISS